MDSLTRKLQESQVRKQISTEAALQIDDMIKHVVLDDCRPIIDWT
jgi:type I restriction enzyme R subunit